MANIGSAGRMWDSGFWRGSEAQVFGLDKLGKLGEIGKLIIGWANLHLRLVWRL